MSARVLVVDDIPVNVRLLEAKLSAEYYDVITATSGAEALALIKAEPPDIVLLDIMMPGIDGFETCQRLKANEVTKSTPVIFISAQVEMAEIEKVFSSGGVDYLNKPFRQEEVLARVSARLEIVKLRQEKDELTSEIKILEEKS